jgi:hypothetical protein
MASTRLLQARRRLGRVRADAIVDARLITRRIGPLPDFVIIGAPRSGTTTLWRFVVEHPGVRRAAKKEIHFFDDHYERGIGWYRAHFPRAREAITGEASPGYLAHPLAPTRMRAHIDETKLIAVLRNPADRAFSHYQHRRRLGRDPRTFEQAIADEEAGRIVDGLRSDILEFGRYAEQLAAWFEVYPRERFLVLGAEEFWSAPEDAYGRTLAFLGLDQDRRNDYPNVNPAPPHDAMDRETRARLVEIFRGPNQRLRELIGADFGWDG